MNQFYLKHINSKQLLQSLAPKANQIEEQATFYHHSEDESTANLSNEDEPVIQLLNGIFETALQKNASDIHLETQSNGFLIRLRIDGVLHLSR